MDSEPEWEWWKIGHIADKSFSMDAIVQWVQLLRSKVPEWTLKPITSEDIRNSIHEFYVIIMRWEFVWCFRIFHPESIWVNVLELGSVVSVKPWTWALIAEIAIRVSHELELPIISVTQWTFKGIIERRGWILRKRKYKKRRWESCSEKSLLEFVPKKGKKTKESLAKS